MREYLDYIQQHAPEQAARVRGASVGEVERLEALVGRRLPSRYREFLLHFGTEPGDLGIPQADFRMDRTLAFHETTRPLPPARFLFIAAHEEDPYFDYYLDCASAEAADGEVVRAESPGALLNPDKVWRDFASLQDMLFLAAFKRRMEQLPHRRAFTPAFERSAQGLMVIPPGTLDSASSVAERLGFERLSQTGPQVRLFERGDAAFFVSQAPGNGGVSSGLAVQSVRELERLADIISDNTALM